MSPRTTHMSEAEILERLKADGAPPDQIEATRLAMQSARERGEAEDDEVKELRRRYLTLPEPKGWRVRDSGGDGWVLGNAKTGRRVIVSVQREEDGEVWLHASISRRDRGLPTYEDMKTLHRLFVRDVIAYQLFVPESEHVSYREVLHLWACLTKRITPDFRAGTGSI